MLGPGTTLIVDAAGTYDLANSNQNLAVIAGSGGINLGTKTLDVGGTNGNSLFSGTISGSGNLNKSGAGTLTLTGENSLTGTTTVSGGTLQVGSGSTSGSLPSSPIINNANLVFNRSDALTHTGVISGSGSLTKTGAGTLILSGNNQYEGATSVTGGTLSISTLDNLGSGPVQVSGGELAGAANMSFERAITVSGANSRLNTAGYLEFGSEGTGSLTVSGGAQVNSGMSTAFGVLGSSDGTGLVTGAGSLLEVGTILYLGYRGEGTLTVDGGGKVSADSIQLSSDNGIGSLNLNSGGTLEIGGSSAITGSGANAHFNFGGGTLRVSEDSLTTSMPVTLAEGTASIIDTNNLNATFSGVLSGSGGLTKAGAGELILSAENDYTGETAITAGTLTLGHQNALIDSTLTSTAGLSFGGFTSATIGGLSGAQPLALTNASGTPVALSVGSDHLNTTYSGSFSGDGSLTKIGSGSLTLAASHSHTGGTTVAGGSLWLAPGVSLGSGPVSVTEGAIHTDDNTLRFPLSLDGASSFWWSRPTFPVRLRDDVSVTNGAQALHAGTLYLIPAASDTITVTVSGENSVLSVPGDLQLTFEAGTGILNVGSGGRVQAGYLGIGAFGGGNGILNLLPGGTFAIGGANQINQGGGGGINFAGGTLEVVGSDLSSYQSAVMTLVEETTSTVNTNGLNAALTTLSGQGGLKKSGEGTLTLVSNNSYSGGTTIEAGRLQISHAGGLGATSANLYLNGGTLDLGAFSPAVGKVVFNGGTFTNGSLDNASAFEVQSGSLSQSLGGSAGLTKTGEGSFTLSGAHDYTGDTIVSSGTLVLDNAAALQNSSASLEGGTLGFDGVSSANLAGLSGSADLALVNASSGAVDLEVGGNHADTAYAGVISGDGSLSKRGAGTLTLSNANVHTGGTTIHEGTLRLGAGNASGSVAGDITNHASLAFDRSDDYTFAGVIRGSGALIHDGSVLRFNAPQSYEGPTRINSGVLVLPFEVGQGLSSQTQVDIASGATLDISNSPLTIAGLSGTGSVYSFRNSNASAGHLTIDTAAGQSQVFDGVLGSSFPDFAVTKTGEGTLTLTGANNYTGATTVNQGRLEFTNGLVTSGAEILVTQNGILAGGQTIARNLRNDADVVAMGETPLTLTGELSGTGQFTGDFVFAGTTRPGNSPGLLEVEGDLTFGADHIFEVEVGGLERGTGVDAVDISGALDLDGTLRVVLIDGFVPAKGDRFRVFAASSYSGEVTALDVANAALPQNLRWDVSELGTSGTLKVRGRTFEEWASDFSVPAHPDADPLAEGVPLLMKYALGLDPNARAASADLPDFSQWSEGDSDYLAVRVDRDPFVEDLSITAEISEDLENWSVSDVLLIEDTESVKHFRDTDPVGEHVQRFIRLQFTLESAP
jgi:autotransporter-associated beta strand protein/T5SS/PEP-CTERM-associated repeat protein